MDETTKISYIFLPLLEQNLRPLRSVNRSQFVCEKFAIYKFNCLLFFEVCGTPKSGNCNDQVKNIDCLNRSKYRKYKLIHSKYRKYK